MFELLERRELNITALCEVRQHLTDENHLQLLHAVPTRLRKLHRKAVAGAATAAEQLDDFGRPDALGILIGNTRKLWPAFTRAIRDDATLANSEQPLDTYVTTRLTTLLAEATTRKPIVAAAAAAPGGGLFDEPR